MNFKLFIYYSATCGGWAAFLTWMFIFPTNIRKGMEGSDFAYVLLMGSLLGMLVAAAVGIIDSILNSSGSQRFARAAVCAGIGLFGGMIGGLMGEVLNSISLPRFIGWIIAGIGIGASVGMYDLFFVKGDKSQARKKTLNGVYGGLLGGFLGGAFFDWLASANLLSQSTSVAFGLVILGASIGLMIGLAQVFLKEAWVRIEEGRRAGKELIISKDEIVIGRAESCDLGLFGEQGIERVHARIRREKNWYTIQDEGTPAGTLVNDEPATQPIRLKDGDLIRLGSCALMFGEREKKNK